MIRRVLPVFFVLLFAVLTAAQVVHITRLDGSVLTVDFTVGGSRAAPVAVDPNLVAWSYPGILCLMNPNGGPWESPPGVAYQFRSLASDVGTAILETDPKRGFPTHRFLGGEIWPFVAVDAIPRPPDSVTAFQIQALLSNVVRLEQFGKYPRLAHLVDLFGDNGVPKVSPGGQHDLGWLLRNWAYRAGGVQPSGWYETSIVPGSDGWDNWHYNEALWEAIKYLRWRRDQDWFMGVTHAVAQSCLGVYHTGTKWRGMYAGEKSGSGTTSNPGGTVQSIGAFAPGNMGFLGRGFEPSWGKSWFLQTVVWWLLTNQHPLLQLGVDAHLARLQSENPKFWGGAWGERIPALYLRDLEIAYLLTQNDIYRQRAATAIAWYWTLRDPITKLWINQGSPPTTSPWMHSEFLTGIWRWMQLGVGVDKKPQWIESFNAVMTRGTFTTAEGFPGTWYRFSGPEHTKGPPQLNGFMIPMLYCGVEAGAVPQTTLIKWTDFTYGPFLGGTFVDAAAGKVIPLTDLGIEYPAQGLSGCKKSWMELMGGLVR